MKKILLIFAAFALAVSSVFAQQLPPLPNDPATRVGKLENGMTYYIRHNDQPAERAEFYLATNVGAIQETPEQDGLAHFLEHMCFNGTENFPEKTLLEYLQSIGVEFGRNINASTGVEQTQYMLNNIPVIREGIIDTCLLIMHDYSHYVTNDPVEVDKERGVILEEKRTRNTASWRMYDQSKQYIYAGSKYADCSLIGSEENLQNFDPKLLVDFYHTWYRPELQAIIVVGDIDVDSIEAKIKALFSDIPNPENPQPKEMYPIPDNDEPIIGILTDPENTSTSVSVYWKDEQMPVEMRNTSIGYLNDLIKEFIYQIMSERFSDISSTPDAPFLSARLVMGDLTQTTDVILATVRTKDSEAIKGFKEMMTEIRKMELYGFTDDEFNRAKDEILSQLEKEVEAADTRKNSEFIRPITNNFFFNEPFMDPAEEYELAQQICSVLNAQRLNQVISQLIPKNNMVIIYEAPDKETVSHPAEADFLAAISEVENAEIVANEAVSYDEPFLDPDALNGATITKEEEGVNSSTEWTLSNGVKVVVLPTQYKKDQIMIQIRKDGGTSLIADEDMPSFDSNIRSSFERMSGISKFSNTTVDKMLSGKQVNVSLSLGSINHTLSATCPPKDLETAFQLLYLKFTDPRFDADEYAVAKNSLNAILGNYVTTPNYKMMKELYGSMYGKDNPRVTLISEEIMEKATMETYEKVYREQLFKDAAGAVVYIVGNVEIETLKPLVEKYIGSLPEGKESTSWVAENVVRIQDGEVDNVFTTTMEAPKTTVYQVWHAATPYTIKDDVACDAISYIMDMIYVDTLREDEGGTYGASVSCTLSREPYEEAQLLVAFDTNPEDADKLRQMAVDELVKFANEGPSEEYFARTIENFKKNLPESRISNNYWLSNLRNYQKYGEDYDALYEAAVNELTAADVQAAAQHIISAGNFIEVVMKPELTEEAE